MSRENDIHAISQALTEPGWALEWRKKRLEHAATLPMELKYGIGIHAVVPRVHGDSAPFLVEVHKGAEYHIDASRGLEVYTWKEAVHHEELVPILRRLMESEFFPQATHYLAGVGQALFSSGIVVYAQPNVGTGGELITERLVLDTKTPPGNASDMVIIIAKEGARLDLMSVIAASGADALFARTLVVLGEQDSGVIVTQEAEINERAHLLITSRGIAAGYAQIAWNELCSGAGRMKSETESLLIGGGARSTICHAIIAGGTTQQDIYASTKHLASYTTSTITAAGVSTGTSKTVYRGLIDMRKGVMETTGVQEARFLSLASTATIDAIPSLDIAANDVRCTHKLAITHLKESDIFYPKLRGLSDVEARRLFLEGHFARLLSEEGRTRLTTALHRQLEGVIM